MAWLVQLTTAVKRLHNGSGGGATVPQLVPAKIKEIVRVDAVRGDYANGWHVAAIWRDDKSVNEPPVFVEPTNEDKSKAMPTADHVSEAAKRSSLLRHTGVTIAVSYGVETMPETIQSTVTDIPVEDTGVDDVRSPRPYRVWKAMKFFKLRKIANRLSGQVAFSHEQALAILQAHGLIIDRPADASAA